MSVPVPTFVRLEYLTPTGWVVGHAGHNLLHPERYVERLTERGKFGRATELGHDLQPTGKVWVSPGVPDDPSVLVPDPPYRVPKMPSAKEPKKLAPVDLCEHCEEFHSEPYDGSCLL